MHLWILHLNENFEWCDVVLETQMNYFLPLALIFKGTEVVTSGLMPSCVTNGLSSAVTGSEVPVCRQTYIYMSVCVCVCID